METLRELFEEISKSQTAEYAVTIRYYSRDGKLKDRILFEPGTNSVKSSNVLSAILSSLLETVNKLADSGEDSTIHSTSEGFYFIDVVRREKTIVIFGAGHVGRSVAIIGSIVGFSIILVDDREQFLRDIPVLNPKIKCLLTEFEGAFEHFSTGKDDAVVIVTRGHQYDRICLRESIKRDAKYIGMIGSKRRVLSIAKEIGELDLSDQEAQRLDKVYAPIGLKIGAKSPEEIAVSIIAQIIQIMSTTEAQRKDC